jgi:hypothetical protein
METEPLFTVDDGVLARFLTRAGIQIGAVGGEVAAAVARAFALLPYENLTKIIKADAVVGPSSAKRLPSEVLSDYLNYGTGGTCFSLTAAEVAVYRAMGVEAYPILADRHYGPDTHCALVLPEGGGMRLIDPGFLLYLPELLPQTHPRRIDNGHNTVELSPAAGGARVDMYTEVSGSRRHRLTYKVEPVEATAFSRAWERSFGWEMMTYPVLTRLVNGRHHYLQGGTLRVRGGGRSVTVALDPQGQGEFVTRQLGISADIVRKAFAVLSHG